MMKLTPDNPCAPVIYYEQYESWLESGNHTLDDVLDDIERQLETRSLMHGLEFQNYEQMEEKLVFRIINYEKNEELLQTAPFRRLFDLAIVCKAILAFSDGMEGSMLVTHSLIKSWGITEDELFEVAEKNTSENYSVLIRSVGEVFQGYGMELEELERLTNEPLQMDRMMFVADAAASNCGGLCLLRKDKFREFANEYNMDLYILPSSIHELVIIPKKDDIKEEQLLSMIHEVNSHVVDKEEFLSNHLYCYLREQDEIIDTCAVA